jgi:hypothetical protein
MRGANTLVALGGRPGERVFVLMGRLNEQGDAPEEFKDYLQSVKWKRALHAQKHGVETTSHDLRASKAIEIRSKRW